jgi:single-stranded-DNA-specific exonuclease
MLNAPGRLGSPAATLELLLCNDEARAAALARELSVANEQRRKVSAALMSDAVAQAETVYGAELPAGIVVGGEGWHPGVGGIVAGRLAERFDRPVIVVALDGSEGAGSARGPKGFPLFSAVRACAAEFVQFGGHDGAAGMRVRGDRMESLRASFASACAEADHGSARASPRADAELHESDLSATLARQLDAFEPTGHAHPEPRVLLRDARWVEIRPVGSDGAHLRARVSLGRRTVTGFVRDGAARRARGELGRCDSRAEILASLRTDPYAGPDAVQLEVLAARDA